MQCISVRVLNLKFIVAYFCLLLLVLLHWNWKIKLCVVTHNLAAQFLSVSVIYFILSIIIPSFHGHWQCYMLCPQFIYDPGLVNDDKLKPIQLPLSRSSSLSKSRLLTSSTCENVPDYCYSFTTNSSVHDSSRRSFQLCMLNVVWLRSCDVIATQTDACVQLLRLSCWQVQRALRPMELRAEQATVGQNSHLWSKSCRISGCRTKRSSSSCSYQTVCQAGCLNGRLTPLLNLQQIDLSERKGSLETRGLHQCKRKWVNRLNTEADMLPW